MSHYPPKVAAAVVIANMIGTGVFTSLGFQLIDIQSAPVIMALWLIGGVSALCGALSYAELGAALPRSGGEYHFLTDIYHPCAGFISGWVSATVGFAAPSALAALTFGSYLSSSGVGADPLWLATLAIIALTAAHCSTRRHSGNTQTLFTVLKLTLIVVFSFAALVFSPTERQATFLWGEEASALLGSGAFAVSLIYVNYAYSGWNAATYISGELAAPQKSLPWVLGISTTIVAALYCLLNFVFLSVAPIDEVVGKVEVGIIVAEFAFGKKIGSAMGLLLALLLISTISAMILAGPRVLHRIGQDYPRSAPIARENKDGIPINAILLQSGTALLFLWTASFEQILIFSGATMALNTFATVLGLFVLRWQRPQLSRPFSVTLYPITPLIFLAITGWTLTYIVLQRPVEALISAAIVASGGFFYWLVTATAPRTQ
ncbi:MAG: amino acid permease [Halieaceae bacterium]|nr:amino acid permease [Halieaceae bacterium]